MRDLSTGTCFTTFASISGSFAMSVAFKQTRGLRFFVFFLSLLNSGFKNVCVGGGQYEVGIIF